MDDRTEIAHLVYQYAAAVDAGDFETVGALFSSGKVLSTDGRVLAEGAESVETFYRNVVILYPETGTPRTQHVMSNLVIRIADSGIEATGRCNYTVFQQTPELPLQTIIAGHYEDRFTSSDGRWSFAERRMTATLTGNLAYHMNHAIKDI